VVTFGSNLNVLHEAKNDKAAALAAIQAAKTSDDRGSFAELARALKSIAQSQKTPVEAHVFSDMQKSGWPANFADAQLGEGVKLVTHPVVKSRTANFSIERVIAPGRIYDPKKVRVQATVAGYGTEHQKKRVALVVNDKEIASKEVDVTPGGRGTAEFTSLESSYGLNRCEIRISPGDSFPEDDRYLFAVERTEPRRVLFIEESSPSRALLYFRTAMDASEDAAFAIDQVQSGSGSPGLGKYALVVVSDVGSMTSGMEENLLQYVRGGGSVWFTLGRYASARDRVPVFQEKVKESRYAAREGERFRTVTYVDPAHPSIRRAPRWEGVKFYQAIAVDPGKSKVLARLSDETPLLMEKQIGEGRVLVFASTFDNVSNDFPLHSSFVPFVVETARYLGRMDEGSSSYPIGAYYELRAASGKGAALEVLDPEGKRALTLEEASKAQGISLTQRGFWDVKLPTGAHELIAVNPDRAESDLEILPAETTALWQNTGQTSTGAATPGKSEEKPFSWWWYVMAAALALAIAETVVGNQHLAVQSES
jgi:hypothetical protein